MLRYTLKRLLSLFLSLAVASVVIFAVIEVAPGDPASFMLGVNAQPDTLAALRTELGLDVPKVQRYFAWVGGMLTGDFGTSYTYRTPVAQMIGDRLWVSLPLALYALGLSTLIAFPAGIYAASRRGQAGDIGVMGATQLGVAIPNFWFAMMLVLIFAINLRWFAAGGFVGWDEGFWAGMHALTLPAIALALPQAAILARVMRSSLLDVLGEDFMRTARAKGLTRAPGIVAAWASKRADPGADDHRPAILFPARRLDHHRTGFLPPRPRAAHLPVHLGPRSDRGGIRCDAAGLLRHRCQLPR